MGTDVYKLVTDTIVERMKQGKIPWKSPYTVRGLRCAVSHGSKEPYSFINQFLLMEPGEYFTFNQVQKEGFRIKKGSKAKFVVFWKMLSYSEAKKIGEFVEESEAELRNARVIPFLKKYNVFHESDIEGFEREKYDEEVDAAKNSEFFRPADDIIDGYANTSRGPKFAIVDCVPHYTPSLDVVECPQKAQFVSLSEYYKTVYHELVHSTGHKDRLNRGLTGRSDMTGYSREELVAEIGASYLTSISGLPDQSVDNAVAYLQGWIKPLQSNPKWIVWAASRAEAATKFILNEQPSQKAE